MTGMRSKWRITIKHSSLAGDMVIDSQAADQVDALSDALLVYTSRTGRRRDQVDEVRIVAVHREPEIEGVPA